MRQAAPGTGVAAPNAVAAVDQARLWQRLMQLAEIGAITGPDGSPGVNRACLTEGDARARRLMIGWATAMGAAISVDPAGNLFLRLEGRDPDLPAVLTGSHMDTQPQGGRFDGIYGVVAGLEAIEALATAGIRPKRAIEVVAWTNEEGGRFAPGCTGSMSFARFRPMSDFDALTDRDGVHYKDALDALLASEADLPKRPLGYTPHAYLEAHIEQGPILEAEAIRIGIVTGIQGSRWFTVTIEGKTDHAGTTPLSRRRDAVQDALTAITALNTLMADPTDVLRFTVGSIKVDPDTSNSVARQVVFTVDFRHPDASVLTARGDAIAGVVQAAMQRCTATVTERFKALPAGFDPLVMDAVQRAAVAQGLSNIRLPSGAFHDAQFMVPLCPTGMIFTPCFEGISHNPREYSAPEHCTEGARVLTQALLELADG